MSRQGPPRPGEVQPPRRTIVGVIADVKNGRANAPTRPEVYAPAARFGMILLGLFAALALVLAAVGVHGLVAYEARQRTHELGIRCALGARPWTLLRLVAGDGLRLAVLGAAIGTAAALRHE